MREFDFRNGTRGNWCVGAGLIVLCFTPLVIAFAKPASVVLLLVTAVLLVCAVADQNQLPLLRRRITAFLYSSPGILLVLLLGWMLASIFWSATPARGAEHVLHNIFGLALAVTALAAGTMVRSRAFMVFLLAGIVLCSLWLIINVGYGLEPMGSLGITRVVATANRATIAVALLVPLMAVLAARHPWRWIIAVVMVLAAAAVMAGTSESAKLALIAGVAVLLLAPIAGPLTRLMVFLAPALVLAAPLISGAVHWLTPKMMEAHFGFYTVTVRMQMWKLFASLVPVHWLKGWGLETTSVMHTVSEVAGWTAAERSFIEWGHPHNAPLQIWVELGLVGALLAAALCSAYFAWAYRLKPTSRIVALAAGVQALAIAFVSHGAWQVWWYALGVLVALTSLFALRMVHDCDQP